MPELPEVETVMRGLEPVMTDQVIKDAWCGEKGLRIPFPNGLKDRLIGAKIQKLERRAKYILVYLDINSMSFLRRQESQMVTNTKDPCLRRDDSQKEEPKTHILAIHLGMSGRIRILAPGSNAPPEIHDHFKLNLTSGHQIILNDARRFGMVFDLPVSDLETHKAFSHLGPEPLFNKFDAVYLYEALKNKSAPIKTTIMDQRLVVGVGNIYACEALYRSNISPLKKSNALSRVKVESLVQNIKTVLSEAIKAGGSTLKDHRLPDGEFGYFQQSLFVYGREEEACLTPKCTARIARITQAGRSTFYCKVCQK